MADDSKRKLAPLLSTPLKLNELILGATLLCYAAGFVITNLYLGSIGIVSFDVLRVRYILTGLLFAFFCGILAFLVRGLLHVLRNHQDKSTPTLLFKVITYSVEKFAYLCITIPLLTLLAGSASNPPIGIPSVSPPVSWSNWFSNAPIDLLASTVREAGVYLLAGLLVLVLIFAIVLVVNPKRKDGTRPSRKDTLKQVVSLQTAKGLFLFAVGYFLFYLVLNTAASLLTFIGTNAVTAGLLSSRRSSPLSEAPARFLCALLALYTIVAAYLVWLTLRKPSDIWDDNDDPTRTQAAWFYLAAVVVAVVVPVYSLGVYPTIPQQIGGGSVVPVEVVVSSAELGQYFGDTSNQAYLIDRTSNSSLFILVDGQQQRVIEVANSQIQSITYETTP